MSNLRKQRAFTLIEVLVYMTVVAIVLTAANAFIDYLFYEHELILEKVEEIKELHE